MNSSGNFLLMKGEVGKVRPSFHSLPDTNFVYGKAIKRDKEGTTDILRNWRYHENSPNCTADVDFKLTNSLSVANGLFTSSQFSKFRKVNKVRIRMNTSQSTKKFITPDITHGRALLPSTPMKAVVNNFYASYAFKQTHEKYHTELTGGTLEKEKKADGVVRNEGKKLFKLKKFLRTGPRTDCWRPSTSGLNNKT